MGSRIFAIMGRAVSPPATLVSVRNGRRPRFMARPVAAASVQALADRPGENARPSDYPCDAVSGPPSGGRSERPRHEPRCCRGQAWLARLAEPGIFTSACSGMPQSLVKRDCWCGREDSNLHGLPHTVLSRTRLPVPPREQKSGVLQCEGGSVPAS